MSIADLLARQGDIIAAGRRENGRIYGQLGQQLGAIPAQTYAAIAAQRQNRQAEDMGALQLDALRGQIDDRKAEEAKRRDDLRKSQQAESDKRIIDAAMAKALTQNPDGTVTFNRAAAFEGVNPQLIPRLNQELDAEDLRSAGLQEKKAQILKSATDQRKASEETAKIDAEHWGEAFAQIKAAKPEQRAALMGQALAYGHAHGFDTQPFASDIMNGRGVNDLIDSYLSGSTSQRELAVKEGAFKTGPNSQESDFELDGKPVKGSYLPGINGQPGKYIYNGQDVTARAQKIPAASVGVGAGNPLTGVGTGEDALKGLSAADAITVKNLASYKGPKPGATMLARSPYWNEMLKRAELYNPSFDFTRYDERQKMRNDYTSGKTFTAIKSLNTAVKHIDTLNDAANVLANSSVQLWNEIKNKGIEHTGGSEVNNFNIAATAVQNELATAFKGTAGTDQEISAWRNTINSAKSKQELIDGVKEAVKLLGGRQSVIEDAWDENHLGGDPNDRPMVISKSSQAVLDKLTKSGGSSPERVIQDGVTYEITRDASGKVISSKKIGGVK